MGLVAVQHVGSSRTRARTCVPCIGRWILNHCAAREALCILLLIKSAHSAGEAASFHSPPCPGRTTKLELGWRKGKEVIDGISSRLQFHRVLVFFPKVQKSSLNKYFASFTWLWFLASWNGWWFFGFFFNHLAQFCHYFLRRDFCQTSHSALMPCHNYVSTELCRQRV